MKSLSLIYFCCGETLKPLYHQIAGGRCDYFTPGGILHTTSVDDKYHSWQSSVHSVKALTAWPIVVKSDTSGIPWSTKLCLGFLGPASKAPSGVRFPPAPQMLTTLTFNFQIPHNTSLKNSLQLEFRLFNQIKRSVDSEHMPTITACEGRVPAPLMYDIFPLQGCFSFSQLCPC